MVQHGCVRQPRKGGGILPPGESSQTLITEWARASSPGILAGRTVRREVSHKEPERPSSAGEYRPSLPEATRRGHGRGRRAPPADCDSARCPYTCLATSRFPTTRRKNRPGSAADPSVRD